MPLFNQFLTEMGSKKTGTTRNKIIGPRYREITMLSITSLEVLMFQYD